MDNKRKYKYYHIDEHVYLEVKSKRNSWSLGICGKLAPRLFGPFEILTKKGLVGYELHLHAHIKVHNVFHASLLKKYVYDTKQVIDSSLLQVELEGEFVPKSLHIMKKEKYDSRGAP